MPIGEALRSESRSFVLEESGHEVIQKRVLMEKSNISHWVNIWMEKYNSYQDDKFDDFSSSNFYYYILYQTIWWSEKDCGNFIIQIPICYIYAYMVQPLSEKIAFYEHEILLFFQISSLCQLVVEKDYWFSTVQGFSSFRPFSPD